jgi:hypothetical protein
MFYAVGIPPSNSRDHFPDSSARNTKAMCSIKIIERRWPSGLKFPCAPLLDLRDSQAVPFGSRIGNGDWHD